MNKPLPGLPKIKPIVKYEDASAKFIQVGKCAFVRPIDHPGEEVSNTKYVRTTKVIAHNPISGFFETENTCYWPATLNPDRSMLL